MYKFCPYCGTENKNYKFCPSCGALLSEGSVKEPEPERPSSGDFVIVGDTLVTYIGDSPFVIIPQGVETIGERAFMSRNVFSVTVPQSIKRIGTDAFANCVELVEVYNCSALDIKLGDKYDNGQIARLALNVYTPYSGKSKLVRDGDLLFYDDGDKVYLIDFIGAGTTLTLPESFRGRPYEIYRDGWYKNTFGASRSRIRKLVIPESETEVYSKVADDDGDDFSREIGVAEFASFSALTELEIPEGVTSIGAHAFAHCSKLMRVSLPASLRYLDNGAFDGCCRLTEIVNKSSLDIVLKSELPSDADVKKPPYSDMTVVPARKILSSESESKLVRDGDFVFYTGEATPELIAYTGAARDLTLPKSFGGRQYAIADSAFYSCKSIVRLAVPDGVTAIGAGVFDYCNSLKVLNVPSTVKSIESDIFKECRNLVEVCDMSGLVAAASKDPNEKLIRTQFGSCVRETGGYLFTDDEAGIRLVGYIGFDSEPHLPDSYNGRTYTIAEDAFARCDFIKSVTLGRMTECVERRAFDDCHALTDVTVPRTVGDMGDCFNGCFRLRSIRFEGTVDEWLLRYTPGDGDGPEILYYDNHTGAPDFCFDLYCQGKLVTDVTVPRRITPKGAFCHCMSVRRVTFEKGSYDIGATVLAGTPALEYVDIPESVGEIGDYAFERSGLRSVTLPSTLRCIDENSFEGCRLKSAVINTSRALLYMFPSCRELTSVTFNAVPSALDEGALQGTGLKSFAIPYGVKTIATEAFGDCEALVSVTIPDSVTAIECEAFRGCTSLKSVSVPRSCAVDDEAFPETCVVTRR